MSVNDVSEQTVIGQWQFVIPKGWPHSGSLEIVDNHGLTVAYSKNILTARRIVAAMNNLRDINTSDLERVNVTTILMARIVKLQRLVKKHLYRKSPSGSEFCGECMAFKSSNKHIGGRLCEILNGE